MVGFLFVWIVSITITVIIAARKGLGVFSYLVIAFLLGPIAIIIAATVSVPPKQAGSRNVIGIFSLQDAQNEIKRLKDAASLIQSRIDNLEKVIDKWRNQGSPQKELPQDVQEQQEVQSPVPAAKEEPRVVAEKQSFDMEVNLGRFWLNKIGIVVFTLGIGFLISYTFKYFTPFMKIAFGYALCAIFFFAGNK